MTLLKILKIVVTSTLTLTALASRAEARGSSRPAGDLTLSTNNIAQGESVTVGLSSVSLPENGFIRVYGCPSNWDSYLKTTSCFYITPGPEQLKYDWYWGASGTITITPPVMDGFAPNGTYVTYTITAEAVILKTKGVNQFVILEEQPLTIRRP